MKYKITELPENYKEIRKIDLEKDKKAALIVNIGAFIIAIIIIALGVLIHGIDIGMYDETDLKSLIAKGVIFILGSIVYIFLHEFVHGIFMGTISGVKPFYGYKGLYAFAGSKAYFNKRDYAVIALAPIVILGAVLLLLNILISDEWFWPIYLIQMTNISGAAGDLYVSSLLGKMPKNILINDIGVSMTVYAYEENSEE